MSERRIEHTQNFLKSKKLINKVLDKTNLSKEDLVLEIGPAKGTITEEIAKRCQMVVAIEKDKKFQDLLGKKFREKEKIKIIFQDFLKYNLPEYTFKVFSNIPFNLTAEIITKLTSAENPPQDAYLIIQKQAAKRFVGAPYNKRTSMYALFLKPWFNTEVVHSFNKTDFQPIPQVDTVLMHIQKKDQLLVKKEAESLYKDFIVYSFQDKGLKKLFTNIQMKRLSKDLGFWLPIRPTELTFEQWLGLFNYFLIGVAEEKKGLVYGAWNRLVKQQSKLQKIHRTKSV